MRSSWLASATKRRIRSSLRWRASSDSPTWSSRVFSASPTRPTSVRGSASSCGHALGDRDVALVERQLRRRASRCRRPRAAERARRGSSTRVAAASSSSPPGSASTIVVSIWRSCCAPRRPARPDDDDDGVAADAARRGRSPMPSIGDDERTRRCRSRPRASCDLRRSSARRPRRRSSTTAPVGAPSTADDREQEARLLRPLAAGSSYASRVPPANCGDLQRAARLQRGVLSGCRGCPRARSRGSRSSRRRRAP